MGIEILLIQEGDPPPVWDDVCGEFTCIRATDPNRGARLFREKRPDVVVVDLGCEEETLSAVICFRENNIPEARFVVLLDLGEPEMTQLARRIGVYGVRDILSRDLPAQVLRAKIRDAIGRDIPI